jgi:hypothetical protein
MAMMARKTLLITLWSRPAASEIALRPAHSEHVCALAHGRASIRPRPVLALQLPFMEISESMGNHDSKIVGADSVD